MRRLATLAPPGTFLGDPAAGGTGVVVGRAVANTEFWRALGRFGSFERLRFFVGEGGDVAGLEAQLVGSGALARERLEVQNLVALPDALAAGELDVVHLSGLSAAFADLVWLRDRYAPRPVPVTAQIHSLSYPRFLGDYLRALLYPPGAGDAIVCSSTAGRAAVAACFAGAAAALAGAAGGEVKQPALALPVVPLGVDVDRLTGGDRARTRQRLGVPQDACVVLGLGRFTEYDKMDLFPLLQAFRGASKRVAAQAAQGGRDPRPYLLLAGARQGTKTPEMVQLWARLLGISEHVRLEVDFPETEKANLLAAADVFVSPSDNLQETFGLSVVEAMAAGLPVVASDFDGYKDTVDDDVGVRVPARLLAPLDRVSELSALLYERPLHLFLGQAIEIDLGALEAALAELCVDGARRARLGAAARARARARYDWRVVIAAYESAWRALGEVPLRGRPPGARPPLAMDFEGIFAGFPSSGDWRAEQSRSVARTPLADQLARGRNQYLIYPELKNLFGDEDVLALLGRAEQPITMAALSAADAAARPEVAAWRRAHAIAWLVKHGLLA
jgi:glycosyltransferase involved in cell wall biosynthesis